MPTSHRSNVACLCCQTDCRDYVTPGGGITHRVVSAKSRGKASISPLAKKRIVAVVANDHFGAAIDNADRYRFGVSVPPWPSETPDHDVIDVVDAGIARSLVVGAATNAKAPVVASMVNLSSSARRRSRKSGYRHRSLSP